MRRARAQPRVVILSQITTTVVINCRIMSFMSTEQLRIRVNELAQQLEQLVQDMNRARPGSYTTDVLRFYACEIDDIAKALKQVVSDTKED
jgi:hypothetical protein